MSKAMLGTRKVIKELMILTPFFQSAIIDPLYPRFLGAISFHLLWPLSGN